MTKVFKLHVQYDGYYGGSVDEYCLLPIEIEGLYAELELGEYEREVYLGEIEGKHSEVYGDLTISVVDLSTMSIKEINYLVNDANTSEFECYFESVCESFNDQLSEEGDEEYLLKHHEKLAAFERYYDLKFKDWTPHLMTVADTFIEKLKEKYITEFFEVTIKLEDKERALKLLNENEIEVL